MYSLENKEVISVSDHEKLIILTYHVQDGAGYTVQKHYLMASVPAESESDDSS